MDHVLEKIEQYYELYLENFIEEHEKLGHKELKENYYYPEVRALIDSMNPIRKLLGMDPIRLSDEMKKYSDKGR